MGSVGRDEDRQKDSLPPIVDGYLLHWIVWLVVVLALAFLLMFIYGS